MIFSNDDQKNKYHQVWKEIFKIVRSADNNENGELKIHEKIRLFESDTYRQNNENTFNNYCY